MHDPHSEPIVIDLSADELAGVERAIGQRVPGGELELGDAAVSAFEVDCIEVGGGYELVCDSGALAALATFADDPAVRLQAGLDEDLDAALTLIDAALEEAR